MQNVFTFPSYRFRLPLARKLAYRRPKTSSWFVKDLAEIKRDPAEVKTLLKEAGLGAELEVVIVARTGEEEENQILQQQMRPTPA